MSEIEYVVSFGEHPSIDDCGALREKVVRCRDCRHHYTAPARNELGPYELHYCDLLDYEVEPEGFCSWAKRKEGDE